MAYKTNILSTWPQPRQLVVLLLVGPTERGYGKRPWDSRNQKMPKKTASVKKLQILRGRVTIGLRREAHRSLGIQSDMSWVVA